jgi:hypothetical protein
VNVRFFVAGAAAVVTAVVLLLVAVGLGWIGGGSTTAGAPATPLAVKTTLSPRPVFFGDPVTADVEVQLDRNTVDPASVRVSPQFDPFVPDGAPQMRENRVGRRETIRYRYTLQCLSDTCLPQRKDPLVIQLPPVAVTAAAGGKALRTTATWPVTAILSRLQKKDLGSYQPHFRRPAAVPPPKYAISPSRTADLLTAIGAVLALVALGVLAGELARLLQRRRLAKAVRRTPLEEALAYTRDAASRPDPADRRKALELLARTLESEGDPSLADTTADVAWSEEAPTPERALELADEVEGTRTNGGGE